VIRFTARGKEAFYQIVLTGFGAHSAFPEMNTMGSFPKAKRVEISLTVYIHLVPRLRRCGTVPPPSIWFNGVVSIIACVLDLLKRANLTVGTDRFNRNVA
jgi:hypothetical protein